VHGKQTGQLSVLLKRLGAAVPHRHVGHGVVGQLILHLLHFSPTGRTTPHGQFVGAVGHVGATVVVGAAVVVGACVVGTAVVVAQLSLHLLHFSPIGITTPHGHVVGTGGHVGADVVVVVGLGVGVVTGQLSLHLLHFSPIGRTTPVGTAGHVTDVRRNLEISALAVPSSTRASNSVMNVFIVLSFLFCRIGCRFYTSYFCEICTKKYFAVDYSTTLLISIYVSLRNGTSI
jgi:hypothetical protein